VLKTVTISGSVFDERRKAGHSASPDLSGAIVGPPERRRPGPSLETNAGTSGIRLLTEVTDAAPHGTFPVFRCSMQWCPPRNPGSSRSIAGKTI
jgi:hypothetical protein